MAKRRPRASATIGTPTIETAVTSASPSQHPTEDEIRVRAYQRYLERGGEPGHEREDWLLAEADLTQSGS